MEDTLISFQVAKLAKEKGFKCNSSDCSWAYLNTNGMAMSYDEKSCVLIPTQSLLQKWLREIHDILVYVDPKSHHYFQYHIITNNDEIISSERSNNWEKMLEKGLQESLKLI